MRFTRRQIFHACGYGASAYLLTKLPDFFPLLETKGRMIRTEIRGRMVWLEEILYTPSNTVYAQYAYHPYQYQNPYAYFGNYQMWQQQQWNAMQYQAYMQQLIQQYTWAQQYQAAMANYMQQYSNSYSLSQPFAMDSIRSIYSYGEGGSSSDDLLLGLNSNRQTVSAKGKPVHLVSAVAGIADDEGFSTRKKERSAGPQSSAIRSTEQLGEASISGSGFHTANGGAFISNREFRDSDSGERGSIVMFDDGSKTQRHLVAVA
jgi:hypothetical protein